MCLEYSPHSTGNLRRRGNSIIAWKVYSRLWNGLQSVWWSRDVIGPGWVVSNRAKKSLSPDDRHYAEIDNGIHVLLHRRDAEAEALYLRGGWGAKSFCVVPVRCHLRDLVGAGGYGIGPERCCSAVFMKVFLRKHDYEEAMQ